MNKLLFIVVLLIIVDMPSAQQSFITIRGDPNAGGDWGVVDMNINVIVNGSDINNTLNIKVVELLIDNENRSNGRFGEFDASYSIFYYTTARKIMYINNEPVSIDSIDFVSATVIFANGKSSTVFNTTPDYYIQSDHYAIGGYYRIHNPEDSIRKYMLYIIYIFAVLGLIVTFIGLRRFKL